MERIKRLIHYLPFLAKLLIAAAAVRLFKRGLLKQNLWLIQEKHTEARDNGYHLYKYLKEKHPEINAYYSIVKGTPDGEKVRPYGGIVDADSFRHYMYWVAAKYSIGSQPYGAIPSPNAFLYRFRKLCRKDQKTVYIKHGVDKDELPHTLDHDKTRFSLISFVAVREKEYMQKTFGYPDQVAQLLGFCRYDRLNAAPVPKRQILVMPTFRSWLIAGNLEKDATPSEMACFQESDYFRNYRALLSDDRLLTAAREKGYQIIFYMHFALQSYTKAFRPLENDTVVVADREHYDVQQLMMESAAMVTDFSSVFFDFAYMKRPEMFFQFDEEQYRRDHFKAGYFDYRRDAFGPVYTEPQQVRDELIRLIQNGCEMSKEYLDRAKNFFAYFDDKNCERTFNAIMDLG